MLKSSLCNYSDEDMLARGIVTITRTGADTAAILADERKKEVIFTPCAPFTVALSKQCPSR